jgi:hypothetical protein
MPPLGGPPMIPPGMPPGGPMMPPPGAMAPPGAPGMPGQGMPPDQGQGGPNIDALVAMLMSQAGGGMPGAMPGGATPPGQGGGIEGMQGLPPELQALLLSQYQGDQLQGQNDPSALLQALIQGGGIGATTGGMPGPPGM